MLVRKIPSKGTLKFRKGQEERMHYFLLKVFMRALFCYNPKEDRAIPCQEAGLPFKRRHILEVVSQDDPTWWQAKRVGDTNLRAGLIPSKQFQERFVNEDYRFLLFLLTNHMVSRVFVLLFCFCRKSSMA